MQKRIISIAIALLLAFGLFGCTAKQEQPAQAEPVQTAEEPSAAEETVPETPATPDVEPQTAAEEPAPAPAAEEAQQIQTAAVEGPAEQSAPTAEAQNAQEQPPVEIPQEAPAQNPAKPAADPAQTAEEPASSDLADGTYQIDIGFSGGTGKAYIQSPVTLYVSGGAYTAKVVWSSINYDYMLVNGAKYLNENAGSNSTFTIPVSALDTWLPVVGDTVAMSTPHEIEYSLYFDSATIR